MRSGDRPGLQNRRVAGNPVTDGFDPHSLPPNISEERARTWTAVAPVLSCPRLSGARTKAFRFAARDNARAVTHPDLTEYVVQVILHCLLGQV